MEELEDMKVAQITLEDGNTGETANILEPVSEMAQTRSKTGMLTPEQNKKLLQNAAQIASQVHSESKTHS